MNKKEQEIFVAFFQQIYEAEETFNEIKAKFAKCMGYNPYLLFQHIVKFGEPESDDLGAFAIEIKKFREYLADKVTCNDRELYELFEKFDKERQGYISSEDFVQEITPFKQPVIPPNRQGKMTAEIEGYFLALINEYIRRFRILEVLRKQLHFIWPYNAFEEIDNFKTGFIGAGQLERFFSKNDYDISHDQIDLLLHGLKRRCYNEVNLEVFCQNLDPLEFGEYEAYKAKIEQQKQVQFLNRSRRQEQTMRRSRIESWKIEHNIAKDERRRRAEKQRQLQLEQRINNELLEHEKQKQRYIRRAMLEEDKNIRWNVERGSQQLQIQKQRHLQDRMRVQDLNIIRNQENDVQHALIRSAIVKEDQLQNSRRARYNIEKQRQIQEELLYKKQLQRREYELQRERRLEQQIQRERDLQRREFEARERALIGQRDTQKQKFISDIEASRRIYEEQLRIDRERALRQFEISRLRNQEYVPAYVEPASASRRVADLQRELQRTRAQIRQRQSRVNINASTNKRQQETADRDYRESRG